MHNKLLVDRVVIEQALVGLNRAQAELRGVTATQDLSEAALALRAALAEQEPKCRRAICQRGPEGYCAPCHERRYP